MASPGRAASFSERRAVRLISLCSIIQLWHAAVTVGIRCLEGGTKLPALPVGIQMLEALVKRRDVHWELRKRNRCRQRDVREGRFTPTKQPFTAVGQMLVDHRRMGQCRFWALF